MEPDRYQGSRHRRQAPLNIEAERGNRCNQEFFNGIFKFRTKTRVYGSSRFSIL
jgi:hypothetical protein